MDNEVPPPMASSGGVVRRKAASVRHYPYTSGTSSKKEGMREEVIELGLEFSLSLAESMFLLSDNIRSVLWFCCNLWVDSSKCLMSSCRGPSPVLERLLRVFHHVYSKHLQPAPNNTMCAVSVHWDFIKANWMDFADGILVLHRLSLVLRRKYSLFDDRLLSSAIAQYKQLLKKLPSDKLRSKANGFAREMIKSDIVFLWRSLFDEDAGQVTPNAMRIKIRNDLFSPPSGQSRLRATGFIFDFHRGRISEYSPYILGSDFAKLEELKQEAVRLGVQLSLYVAEFIFVLCDDISTVLRFCYRLWTAAIKNNNEYYSPVGGRLLRVMHYVYSKDIVPKNGVYQAHGRSVQHKLIKPTYDHFYGGISDLKGLVYLLSIRGKGSYEWITSLMEDNLKKLEEMLNCAKAVSKANGFSREAIEPQVLDLWKSLFDREAKEASETLEMINDAIYHELFLPLANEAPPP